MTLITQFVLPGILLNLAGGNCVDDLNVLNADKVFFSILNSVENHKLPRKERRELERRWRKEKIRFVPSPSPLFRYLNAFHGAAQEQSRRISPVKTFTGVSWLRGRKSPRLLNGGALLIHRL